MPTLEQCVQQIEAAIAVIRTPREMPFISNDANVEAVSQVCAEIRAREKPVDRRTPQGTRYQLQNLSNRRAAMEAERAGAARTTVDLVGKLASLRKAEKLYAKSAAVNLHSRTMLEDTRSKISEVERQLGLAMKNESRLDAIVKSSTKLIEHFLTASPGKGFSTNKEFLAEYEEQERLEREVGGL